MSHFSAHSLKSSWGVRNRLGVTLQSSSTMVQIDVTFDIRLKDEPSPARMIHEGAKRAGVCADDSKEDDVSGCVGVAQL